MQSHSVKEIRKCRKNTQMFVNKLPYKHLLKEFANDLHTISSEESPLVTMLHEASQAYLDGIFDGYSNVCQNVAKKESTGFLPTLASLGLKRLVTTMAQDKELASRARASEHHFHRNLINNLHRDHDHGHHHDDNHHGHEHDHAHDHEHGHNHDQEHNHNDDNQQQETRIDQANNNQRVDDVIQRIRRRISSNVTVSVLGS